MLESAAVFVPSPRRGAETPKAFQGRGEERSIKASRRKSYAPPIGGIPLTLTLSPKGRGNFA